MAMTPTIPRNDSSVTLPGQSARSIDITSNDTLQLFQRYIRFLIMGGEMGDAYGIVRGIPKLIKNAPELTAHVSALSQGYDEVVNLARALALPMLTDDEIMEYFKKGVVYAFRNPDIELIPQLEAKMVQHTMLDERDEFKKKLQFALKENWERITLQGIKSSTGIVAPTVHEWIIKAERHKTEFDRPLLLAVHDDPDFGVLGEGEQRIVRAVMTVYDFCSLLSDTPAGFEEAITIVDEAGRRLVIEAGQARPAVDPETEKLYSEVIGERHAEKPSDGSPPQTQTPATSKVAGYRDSVEKAKAEHRTEDEIRYAAQEDLIKEVGSDTGTIVKKLGDALQQGDRDGILVPLSVLVRFGALDVAIQDERIRDEFEEEFMTVLADAAKVSHDHAFALIRKNSGAPTTVATFLYWALQKATKDNEDESAQIGNQLGNIIAALGKPEYVRMTYFDVKTARFRWTKVTLKQDGTLSWME